MDTQTVAVFHGPRTIELVDEPIPTPGPGEVLIRNRACALCTMERRVFEGQWDGYPIVPGHEIAGEVAAIGPGVTLEVSVGDRVALAVMNRCMQCRACRRGHTQLCTGKARGRQPGQLRRLGGLGRYLAVPATKVFWMPPTTPFSLIAMTEPLACVIHSVRRAQLHFGDDVVVIGGGTMGHLHMLLARSSGARVLLCDPDPRKRALAAEHGAHGTCTPEELRDRVATLTRGEGADAVFVTFGTEDTALAAYEVVADGGRVIFYASFPSAAALPVSPHQLHKREIILDGAANQEPQDWQAATRLIGRELIDLRHIVTRSFPLEQIESAFEHAVEAQGFRTLVTL